MTSGWNIGDRVRLTTPQDILDYYDNNSPQRERRELRTGMTGTIVAPLPNPMAMGSGPTVKWDDGRTTGTGSGDRLELIQGNTAGGTT